MCVQDCQLSVYKPNPRQYIASISQVRCEILSNHASRHPLRPHGRAKAGAGNQGSSQKMSSVCLSILPTAGMHLGKQPCTGDCMHPWGQ